MWLEPCCLQLGVAPYTITTPCVAALDPFCVQQPLRMNNEERTLGFSGHLCGSPASMDLSGAFWHLWASLGPSGLLRASMGLFRPLWASLGLSGPLWACPGFPGPLTALLGIYWPLLLETAISAFNFDSEGMAPEDWYFYKKVLSATLHV